MFSVYKSLLNYRNIILGSKILDYTNNKNIISNSNDPIKRIERWNMTLQEFDYSMKYYQGKLNCGADALFRMFKISTSQTQDKHLNMLQKFFKNRKMNEIGKFILDKNNENESLIYLHEILGHPGINSSYNTLKKIIETDYWKKKITLIVQECHKCQTCKHYNSNKPLSKGFFYTEVPNFFVSTDIVEPFTKLSKNEGY
ncbi:Transposon Tf2-11 polyprotein [Dictyocoela muelleri]|nr:Transposon Tf2-11 polyprotein [Dictyocoela muelleri]